MMKVDYMQLFAASVILSVIAVSLAFVGVQVMATAALLISGMLVIVLGLQVMYYMIKDFWDYSNDQNKDFRDYFNEQEDD